MGARDYCRGNRGGWRRWPRVGPSWTLEAATLVRGLLPSDGSHLVGLLWCCGGARGGDLNKGMERVGDKCA